MIPGLRRFFRIPDARSDLDAEIAFHVEEHARDLIRRGMDPDAAMRSARAAFGDRDRYTAETLIIDREHEREARMTEWLDSLRTDVRYAVRGLRRAPAFTATAAVTLALGIGATVAVFGAVSGAILRPLPFVNADRIVHVGERQVKEPGMGGTTSSENAYDWQRMNRSFAALGLFSTFSMSLTGLQDPQRVEVANVTPGIFDVFHVTPALGRRILASDTVQGAPDVALVSWDFFQAKFGGDPAMVGRTVQMNFRPIQIIGVLPQGFRGPRLLDRPMWLNFTYDSSDGRGGRSKDVYALLKPGVTATQAQRDMDAISRELAARYPRYNKDATAQVDRLADVVYGDVRRPLLLLLGASALVLMIACANISNLLVVRGIGRSREIAVRAALGAGRARIARQMFVEAALLAAIGCGAGLALAVAALRLITALGPTVFALRPPVVDTRVLLFSVGAAAGCALIFGLAPAMRGAAVDLFGTLRSGGRGLAGSSHRGRSALALAQLALALVLVTSSALVLKSFARVLAVDPGVATENRLYADIWLPRARYDSGRSTTFYAQLEQRLKAAPGVQDVAFTSQVPLSDYLDQISISEFGGRAPLSGGDMPTGDRYIVTPSWFKAMHVTLVRGRVLEPTDNVNAPPVAVVDERFARAAFGDANPIGQTMRIPGRSDQATIVGVVKHVKTYGLDAESPGQIYIANAQYPWRWLAVVVHTQGDAAHFDATLARAVRDLDPDQPISNVSTMQHALDEHLRSRRFALTLLGAFAVVALVLAAVGLYGVIAYGVTQRRQELGVRAALGASSRAIAGMVLREGMTIVTIGALVGLVVSLATGRVLAALLFQVSPSDASVLLPAAATLALIALVACAIPARRAMRVNPVEVLRGD